LKFDTFCPYCLSSDLLIVTSDCAFQCATCKLRWSYEIEEMRRDIHETLEEMSHEVPG